MPTGRPISRPSFAPVVRNEGQAVAAPPARCVPDRGRQEGHWQSLTRKTAWPVSSQDAGHHVTRDDLLSSRSPRSSRRSRTHRGRNPAHCPSLLARMRPELSVGAALPPAGRQRRGGGGPGGWHARVAWATMPGWLVMTAGPRCCG
jgi:hypothetical protein